MVPPKSNGPGGFWYASVGNMEPSAVRPGTSNHVTPSWLTEISPGSVKIKVPSARPVPKSSPRKAFPNTSRSTPYGFAASSVTG
jgi:hypothetical protein